MCATGVAHVRLVGIAIRAPRSVQCMLRSSYTRSIRELHMRPSIAWIAFSERRSRQSPFGGIFQPVTFPGHIGENAHWKCVSSNGVTRSRWCGGMGQKRGLWRLWFACGSAVRPPRSPTPRK